MNKKCIDWSEKNYSYLPWRKNRTLYTTLVSEIMLQQTTVTTVMQYFDNFIKKYPSLEKLAQIDEEQIMKDWKGLGYYRRARNLLKAAKEISVIYKNEIPLDYDLLINIHGIGDYTANALIAIGANKNALALDANLERVLARFYNIKEEKGPKLIKLLQDKFQKGEIALEINQFGARAYNEALMDIGRSICKANQVFCELCPLSQDCKSRNAKPLEIPIKKIENKQQHTLHLLRVLIQKNDELLVFMKNEKEWLAGQEEIPTFILYSDDDKCNQYPLLFETDYMNLPFFVTGITKYKIYNHVMITNEKEFKLKGKKYYFKKTKDLNLSTASLKALSFFDLSL